MRIGSGCIPELHDYYFTNCPQIARKSATLEAYCEESILHRFGLSHVHSWFRVRVRVGFAIHQVLGPVVRVQLHLVHRWPLERVLRMRGVRVQKLFLRLASRPAGFQSAGPRVSACRLELKQCSSSKVVPYMRRVEVSKVRRLSPECYASRTGCGCWFWKKSLSMECRRSSLQGLASRSFTNSLWILGEYHTCTVSQQDSEMECTSTHITPPLLWTPLVRSPEDLRCWGTIRRYTSSLLARV